MADQTVRIEKTDIAAVTYEMARSLWVEETDAQPKASDAKFLMLVAICHMALSGYNPTAVQTLVNSVFARG